MKKHTQLTFLAILSVVIANGQTFEWARSFGGTGYDIGTSLTIDASGNVYTIGYFIGTTDFDPGPDTVNITSVGGSGIFVQKMDSSGNFIWAKSFGGIDHDRGYSLNVDASGNVYITGYFQQTADFDPGPDTANLSSAGAEDIFVQKMNSSGDFLWARSFGGTSPDYGNSLSVDNSGNIYITGYFTGIADFDPGLGTANLSSVGGVDIFVQKMDGSGNFLWAKSFGGIDHDKGHSLSVDNSGNVYTTGYFQQTADFDPGPGTANLSSTGSWDIFVQKMDASGNFIWARSFGGTTYDIGYSLSLDNSGNVYTTGYFHAPADFDPGVGTANLSSAGESEIFVQKLDGSGNFLWAKSFGGTDDDISYSLSIDNAGNIYTTGYFTGISDFDPGAGTADLTSAGEFDIFVQKMDGSGNFLWAKSFGGTIYDKGHSLSVDNSGNVYITGSFQETADFDPGIGTANLSSAGGDDAFVQKMSQSINCSAGFTLSPDPNTQHNWFALNTSSGTPTITYDWNWGDGSSNSSGAYPSHTYSTAGYYNICVTITDGSGCSDTYCDNSTYIYKTAEMITVNVVDQLPTAITETENGLLRVYPNPATNTLTIETASGKGIYKLQDITGKVLLSGLASGETKFSLDISALSKGIYLLNLFDGEQQLNRKIIKE